MRNTTQSVKWYENTTHHENKRNRTETHVKYKHTMKWHDHITTTNIIVNKSMQTHAKHQTNNEMKWTYNNKCKNHKKTHASACKTYKDQWNYMTIQWNMKQSWGIVRKHMLNTKKNMKWYENITKYTKIIRNHTQT